MSKMAKYPDIIYSKNLKVSAHSCPNTLVIGGAGTGVFRHYVKPNIRQMNMSYFITDPSGNLYHELGKELEYNGYDVRVVDLLKMSGNAYDPFYYCRSKEDISALVDAFMLGTGTRYKALHDLLCGCIEVMIRPHIQMPKMFEIKDLNANFHTLSEFIDRQIEDEPFRNDSVGIRFPLKAFYDYPEKTRRSTLRDAKARLEIFTPDNVKTLTSDDTVNLTEFADHKSAIFVIMPMYVNTYSVIANMMYTQLFRILTSKKGHGDVHFFINNFAGAGKSGIGRIDGIEKKLKEAGDNKISHSLVAQNICDIKAQYPEWKAVVKECNLIFMGSHNDETRRYVTKRLGDSPITDISTGDSHIINLEDCEEMPYENEIIVIDHKEPMIDTKYGIEDPETDNGIKKCLIAGGIAVLAWICFRLLKKKKG